MIRSSRRAARWLAVVSVLAVAVAGCDGTGSAPGPGSGDAPVDGGTTAAGTVDLQIATNVADGATDVPVDTLVKVSATDGTLSSVVVRSAAGRIPGRWKQGRTAWVASERLEPGAQYRVRTVGENADGVRTRSLTRFTTQPLTLDQQTYASVAPLDGETVGVGMPVVVHFDLPVADRASFEKHMSVTATPRQVGSWRWVSDTEARYRPKSYWKPGTEVSVDIDVNGVPAGDGIYGQESRDIDFSVGKAHVYRIDARTHQMKVFEDGRLLRTMPITTGKPGFVTRSGVKVIMAKSASRRMNSETIGIPTGSAEGYDLDNVRWAMRLTSSGEFIHAAPWSVGSQGHANVSHGCTGMSTEDAGWLYAMSRRGDVVETVGTGRPMEPDNGYGDWNLSWSDYTAGSALS